MLRARVTVLLVAAALGALLLAYGSAAVAQEEDNSQGGPPVVTFAIPAGRSHVERDYNIRVNFSEDMRDRSINGKTLRLYEGDELVPATISYYSTGRFWNYEAVLDPKRSLLKPKTEYTVVVEGAADDDGKAVKAYADGTPMAADYTFSFTTGKH